ncbi:MAG: sel1 repeat family protein, partial [Lentisphaeria bacterium]|nr:sel1 repeat family protein [Lentisphaeria bacterium]
EAFKYLKQAEQNPENQYMLGCLCRDGKGTAPDPAAAAAYFRHAADHGHALAGKEFGKFSHYGMGVKKDDLLAVRYLVPSADRNDTAAALLLAEICADEKSPAYNAKYALKYFRVAARAGNISAMYRCGEMILNGKGTEKDAASALEYLKAAAKGNHAESAFLCGKIEQSGKKPEQCIGYYRQAADLGHTEAIRIFAGMALNGQYMKADPELAIKYLKLLAERGEVSASEQLGRLYESGIGKVRADVKEAIYHYTAAAENGSIQAQLRLGQLYYALGDHENAKKYAAMAAERKSPEAVLLLNKLQHPPGKKQDRPADSDRYLRELADGGNREAMKQVGRQLYSQGHWLEAEKYLKPFENENDPEILFMLGTAAGERADRQDNIRAFQLMSRAAEAGHVKALIRMGQMYQRGEGVRQDFRKALACYRRAAEKKDPEGMFLTGCMFYNGEGVSPDYMEAYRWFLQAAEKGNVLAMQYLAIMFKEGIGVPKNNLEAVKWRRKASGGK